MIHIAVLNESTVVPDAAVQAAVHALQIQVSRDFAPIWNTDAQINFHPSKIAPPTSWQIVVTNDPDTAGALGYHELTAAGLPLGKVFAGLDIQDGTSWTVTLSHELLEMLADEDCDLSAETDNADGTTTFRSYEVADPVEADALGYEINGVLLSDFVTPAWFLPKTGMGPFDLMNHLKAPFSIAPGGYISILQVPSSTGWQQVTADMKPGGPPAPRGSRRWRRQLPDQLWKRSTRGI